MWLLLNFETETPNGRLQSTAGTGTTKSGLSLDDESFLFDSLVAVVVCGIVIVAFFWGVGLVTELMNTRSICKIVRQESDLFLSRCETIFFCRIRKTSIAHQLFSYIYANSRILWYWWNNVENRSCMCYPWWWWRWYVTMKQMTIFNSIETQTKFKFSLNHFNICWKEGLK